MNPAPPVTTARIRSYCRGVFVTFEGAEVAVDADDRRLTELEMDVAGPEIDGLGENVVEAHSRPIGRRGRII